MTTHTDTDIVRGWLTGRLPQELFTAPPEVTVDRDEILVIGEIEPPEQGISASDSSKAERAAAADGRIRRFRELTRHQRIAIAREAEARFGRKVAWGATCGGRREVFTSLAVPVMTRLRQSERRVLDTLVESGVARSRADALAWSVRLVGTHAQEWLAGLRTAMEQVGKVREQGPATDSAPTGGKPRGSDGTSPDGNAATPDKVR